MDNVSALDLMNAMNSVKRDGDDFGGGGMWLWLIIIFLFFGRNGGLFGGGATAEAQQISNDFLFSNLNGQINQVSGEVRGVQNGLCTLGYESAMQFAGLQKAISDCCCSTGRNIDSVKYDMAVQNQALQAQMSSCCCETNRNIDAVRYENAKNTCDIITSGNMNTRDLIATQTASTQAILDRLNQQEVQGLRDRLTSYEIQLSNQAQSASIIGALRPAPIPAYPVCSPFGCQTPVL